jgi:phosphoglycolate phosphatase
MKLIVFDWDGTLADSTGVIVHALQRACHDLALPIPTPAQARHVIGLGLRDTLLMVAPTLSETRYPEMVAAFRRHFLEGEDDIILFEGVVPMLEALNEQGALLAVATGKSRAGLDRAFQKLGIGGQFITSRCADQGQPKPHPEMLLHVMNVAGVHPDRTVMVGDTTHDMMLASNAGVKAYACAYGAHPHNELDPHGPLAVAQSVQELHQHLMKWLDYE